MNIFEYVPLMKEMGTPFAIAGVALLALFLLIIILKMLFGMRRGFWRQLIRTGVTLLAAIISYICAAWLSNHIIGSLEAADLNSLILALESYVPGAGEAINSALSAINPEIVEYIILLPAAILIIPVLTTVLFLVINLVLKIVRAIVIKIIGLKKSKNNTQRLGGALLAAVEGIIWIIMVVLPICATLSLVDMAYNEAIENNEDSTSLTETYEEYLAPFTQNPAISFVSKLGANAMADGIATVKINDERTNLREEIVSVVHMILVEGEALKGADYTNLTPENKEAISSIVDSLDNSPFMSSLIVGVIQVVPTAYEKGLIPIDFGKDYERVVESLVLFLGSVESTTLNEDLTTIKQFYFGFSDSGLISAINNGEDIMQFISDDYKGDKHILGMINTLSGNDRTKGVVDSLYNLVLNAAFSGSSNSENDGQGDLGEALPDISIEDVKTGLNNIVSVNKSDYETEEEYREVLSTTIDTTINDTIGVDLDDEVVDEVADYVDENYSEQLDDLTDEEFNELIFEVIDIYQGYLNGDEINPDDLENLLPGEEDSQ